MEHILGQGQSGMNMNVPDIKSLPAIRCPKCGCLFFEIAYILRVLPSVASPDGNEHLIPDTVFKCAECGSVLGYSDKVDNSEDNNDVETEDTNIFEEIDDEPNNAEELKIIK